MRIKFRGDNSSSTNTNSSGDVTFNLDSNTYIVKMHKTGYYFANQTLVVPATTLYKISDIA